MNKVTGKSIEYAIVRIPNTTFATITNSEGKFELWLAGDKSILIVSHIGYNSDTLSITANNPAQGTSIFLDPVSKKRSQFITDSVSLTGLVAKIIQNEKQKYAELNDYEFNAYNRCVILENNDVGIGSGSVNIDPGLIKRSFNLISNIWETKPLRINGIDEFLIKGYYEKPDSYNEIVQDRNSRSVLPRTLNSLLGTRIIQDLCSSELIFFDRPFPGPVSLTALRYYKYSFNDTLQMDNEKIFKIYFEPSDSNDPGLKGNNFESISLKQQYLCYEDSISLPVDFRLSAISNYIGIIKAQYRYSVLINSYKINSPIIVQNIVYTDRPAMADPGKKDSIIISDHRTLPFTKEESIAYERIDSVRSQSKGFIYEAGKILSPQYRLNGHYLISGPLGIYHFNHVEGHTLSFTLNGNYLLDGAANARITLSNGFSDLRCLLIGTGILCYHLILIIN